MVRWRISAKFGQVDIKCANVNFCQISFMLFGDVLQELMALTVDCFNGCSQEVTVVQRQIVCALFAALFSHAGQAKICVEVCLRTISFDVFFLKFQLLFSWKFNLSSCRGSTENNFSTLVVRVMYMYSLPSTDLHVKLYWVCCCCPFWFKQYFLSPNFVYCRQQFFFFNFQVTDWNIMHSGSNSLILPSTILCNAHVSS